MPTYLVVARTQVFFGFEKWRTADTHNASHYKFQSQAFFAPFMQAFADEIPVTEILQGNSAFKGLGSGPFGIMPSSKPSQVTMGTNEAEDLVTFVDDLMMPVRTWPRGSTQCIPRCASWAFEHGWASPEEPDYGPSESTAFRICGADQLALCLHRRRPLTCARFWGRAGGKYHCSVPMHMLKPWAVSAYVRSTRQLSMYSCVEDRA